MTFLGKHVRNKREALGWTQNKLSEILQISTNHISMWETGARIPTREMYELLRQVLELHDRDYREALELALFQEIQSLDEYDILKLLRKVENA